MVTNSKTVSLGLNHDISYDYDYANKDYLTKKDTKDKSDYIT